MTTLLSRQISVLKMDIPNEKTPANSYSINKQRLNGIKIVLFKSNFTLVKKTTLRIIGFHSLIVGVLLLSVSISFQSCEPDDSNDENKNECDTCIRVLKPNIYLYPTEKSLIDIKLSFPLGGKIVNSIPIYSNGWTVNVNPSGIINDKYEYLFYESDQPDVWQLIEGWVINKTELKTFFTDNLLKHGFNEKEIKDFIDYWIPRLTDFDYYEIYPQELNIIETTIKLEIYKIPDNLLRLFYLIKGVNRNSNNNISIPNKPPEFNRSGFCVTEWGVILKQ